MLSYHLVHKALTSTAADNIWILFNLFFFSEKKRLDILCESSNHQMPSLISLNFFLKSRKLSATILFVCLC